MHVFFEDDGAFKAGTVLADNDSSLQVETAHGKRMKDLQQRVTEMADSGLLSSLDTSAVEFYQAEADLWLAQARTK